MQAVSQAVQLSDQQTTFLSDPPPGPEHQPSVAYQVLARAYRPQRFSELIGQEALVRTLANALRTGRIAHAFLLTGIRGVGKTTTARIIARALNCIGPDGKGEPTPEPCGVCEHCTAIAEGRHIDILEMDAATHTGIDDIRDLVDSVRYAPTSARYKVYIVDEVHMLSEKAFNGLLKTLEEPPPQTLFIFATTEVRKVPITVLSRCQRFDLRRIESDVLSRYFATIAEREGIQVEAGALAMVSRAAEGSVRDGLSLLDQAIALSGGEAITTVQVQDMLGLADRGRVLDLFERMMRGDVAQSLASFADLYECGSEPEAVVSDLLEISHWLTRLKVATDAAEEPGATAWDGTRGRAMAAELSLAELSRAWQMLLKGLDDLRTAPSPLLAAEMLIIRLAHAADLPTAEAMLTLLNGGGQGSDGGKGSPGPSASGQSRTSAGNQTAVAGTPMSAREPVAPAAVSTDRTKDARPTAPTNGRDHGGNPGVNGRSDADQAGSFPALVELFRRHNKPLLHGWLHGRAKLVHFEPGRIELERGDPFLAERRQEMATLLKSWTGRPWQVAEVERPGAPSLTDQEAEAKRRRLSELADDPRVKPVLETFPGARIIDVRTSSAAASPTPEQMAENR